MCQNTKSNKLKISSLYFLISLIALASCQDIEPTVILEVSVIDKLSELRDSVTVSIYSTESDWETETNPLQESQLTDNQGRVRFFGLTAGEYFVDTKLNDSLSNLEGKTRIPVDTEGSFSLEPITLIVDKNASEMLSDANGKVWRMTRAELFELDYTEDLFCLLDDELVFYKGNRSGKYEHRVGSDLCDIETSQSGTWTLDETGGEMIIETENGVTYIDVISVSSNQMVLQQSFDFDIFEYEVYYEVVK